MNATTIRTFTAKASKPIKAIADLKNAIASAIRTRTLPTMPLAFKNNITNFSTNLILIFPTAGALSGLFVVMTAAAGAFRRVAQRADERRFVLRGDLFVRFKNITSKDVNAQTDKH